MEHVQVLQRPKFIVKCDRNMCPLGHPVASEFLISLLRRSCGGLSTRVERFAATDFVIMDAVGFGAATPEEPVEVGPDRVLRLSVVLEFDVLTIYIAGVTFVFP